MKLSRNKLYVLLLILVTLTLVFFKKKKSYEKFISSCLGARDGVSGCRNCCRKFNTGKLYRKCVSNCMIFK